MSRGEAEEWMIHDEEIVTIQILLDGSFAKLAQGSSVPPDRDFGMLCIVFGNPSVQGGVATGMIPGEPFESNSHTNLPALRNIVLGRIKQPDASQPAKCARNTGPLHRAGSTPHKPPQCAPTLCASGLPAYL